ncbi:MAG: tyrosine--tRNA ligase [Candidatus Moraniibacteriota bacterium]
MAKVITDEKLVDELLERGTEEVIVKEHLKKRMMAGEKLRIKLGIDPTGSVLHLGHAVVLKKMKQFQDLGHQVIFLIGDFTAKIGDPTGRSSARKPLTDEDVKKNMESYQKQAGIMLDMEKVEVRYNSEWLAKLSFKELIVLTSKITYAQMAQRADFKERIKNDIDLSMQEFMYPAMQGYDSVVLRADVELGGTDQKFNLLMGRQLQKRYDQEPQDVLTCPLLEGLGGIDKMSKSLNNYISLTEESNSMFGKIMSLADELIIRYFELCTEISMDEIEKIKKDLKDGKVNPRDVKIKLAHEITKIYHGEEKANEAKEYFEKVISRKETPDEVAPSPAPPETKLIDLMIKEGLAESNGDAKRKIEQGGVSLNGEIIKDIQTKISKVMDGKILKVGKREFRKIVVR